MTKSFIDTNILIYAFAAEDRRVEAARAVLAEGGVFSVQVANEFADVSRRKLRWDWQDVSDALDAVRSMLGSPVPLTHETHLMGVGIAQRYGLTIYDSLILSAAQQAGCSVLQTEDLQHGQTVASVLVRNPFRDP